MSDYVDCSLKPTLALRPEARAKWLGKALFALKEGNVRVSDVYDIVKHPKFVNGLPDGVGKKMRRCVSDDLHLFSAKQKQGLEDSKLFAQFPYTEPARAAPAPYMDENRMEEMMARCRSFVKDNENLYEQRQKEIDAEIFRKEEEERLVERRKREEREAKEGKKREEEEARQQAEEDARLQAEADRLEEDKRELLAGGQAYKEEQREEQQKIKAKEQLKVLKRAGEAAAVAERCKKDEQELAMARLEADLMKAEAEIAADGEEIGFADEARRADDNRSRSYGRGRDRRANRGRHDSQERTRRYSRSRDRSRSRARERSRSRSRERRRR